MGFRCELCDEFLNIFQFSHLCDKCYRIRTITKCYSAETILNCLENNFLLSPQQVAEFKVKDKKFMEEEEKRLEQEFNNTINGLFPNEKTEASVEPTEKLPVIDEEKSNEELLKEKEEERKKQDEETKKLK